jgi:uncharacterized DUF497 family protein
MSQILIICYDKLDFEWDEQKREANLAKHGVDFRRMVILFESGDLMEVEDDREDYGETRLTVYGEIDCRLYVVTYTWRKGNRRIISAGANDREKRKYHARHR